MQIPHAKINFGNMMVENFNCFETAWLTFNLPLGETKHFRLERDINLASYLISLFYTIHNNS